MTDPDDAQSKNEPPARGNRWGRRSARRAGAGAALVARGEPFVWLSGGALAVSLLMVTGLLALIVYQGLVTFWPGRILQMQLRDGRSVMGEVTRDESYEPNRGIKSRRRQLRIGNYELTNRHYDWFPDDLVVSGSETLSEWALLVERVEWGRFYGFPREFALRTQRPVSADEKRLAAALQFFEARSAVLGEDQRTQLASFLDTELRPQLRALRRKSFEELQAGLPPAPEGAQRVALLESGRIVPADRIPDDDTVAELQEIHAGEEAAWNQYLARHASVRTLAAERRRIERAEIGALNRRLENARLKVRERELELELPLLAPAESAQRLRRRIGELERELDSERHLVEFVRGRFGADSVAARIAAQLLTQREADTGRQLAEHLDELRRIEASLQESPRIGRRAISEFDRATAEVDRQLAELNQRIAGIRDEIARYELRLGTADGHEKALSLADIVRAFPANRLTWNGRLGVYFSRWAEFLTAEPREANSEGGILPAIWGTVVMTLIMSLAVVPFGVLAALYLREYAKAGLIVSAVRISVNNLAGVPSIVFGVFGLGFFCYIVGAYLDGGPKNAGIAPWPPATWFVALGALAGTGTGAFLLGLVSISKTGRERAGRRWLGRSSMGLWLVASLLFVAVVARTPYFDGLFVANLPNPTFGKGGLLWASLTLSLLTLPVVIVATEEAISAVPNSMREGSYACGASKWQTIRRIVLPRALPGILTGMILAMARGAGEVAPLMLVGAVKLAPQMPVDLEFPFFHGSRSFMHLGFHIYDLGFQSPNSEAARPMVFTTTLLLIFIVASLNFAAIWLRGKLRRRFGSAQF